MADPVPEQKPHHPAHSPREMPAVTRWMNTSRDLALKSLFAQRQNAAPRREHPIRLPLKTRITNDDRDALRNAGLILLVIAAVAFVVGLS